MPPFRCHRQRSELTESCCNHAGAQIERLPVFYRQHRSQFYPAWAFVIPASILRIPFSLMEGTLWTVLTYFEVGLTANAGRQDPSNPRLTAGSACMRPCSQPCDRCCKVLWQPPQQLLCSVINRFAFSTAPSSMPIAQYREIIIDGDSLSLLLALARPRLVKSVCKSPWWWCRFFAFLCLLFLMHQFSVSFFRLVGAICRNVVIAFGTGSFALITILMLGGFVISYGEIPPAPAGPLCSPPEPCCATSISMSRL